MNKFEAVLLISPDLSNPLVVKEEEAFASNITKNGGKIVSIEDWGLRDLSYSINNYKKSFYKFYQIEIDGINMPDIKKILTQNEKILRHLFIKVDKHQKLPTKMLNNEEK
tara:strand:- start:1107 stop:1436 length:330 start_codon:yes stop_codon:yes gene_type:complete